MAGEVTVEWEGLTTLIEKMSRLSEEVPQNAETLMGEIGKDAKATMDDNTPVRSGELKASNQVEVEGLTFTLTNDSDHAIYLEMGTRYMPAQPFLAPATEAATEAMKQRLPEAIK